MKKTTKPPVLNREPRIKLKDLTCSQLVEWLQKPLEEGMVECDTNKALRGRYAHPTALERLKLCGSLKASHHAAHVRTAARLQKVPTLILTATGGKPKAASMPRYCDSLRKMGLMHGVQIHRFDKGAFIMHKNPPKPEAVEVKLCDGKFQLKEA